MGEGGGMAPALRSCRVCWKEGLLLTCKAGEANEETLEPQTGESLQHRVSKMVENKTWEPQWR